MTFGFCSITKARRPGRSFGNIIIEYRFFHQEGGSSSLASSGVRACRRTTISCPAGRTRPMGHFNRRSVSGYRRTLFVLSRPRRPALDAPRRLRPSCVPETTRLTGISAEEPPTSVHVRRDTLSPCSVGHARPSAISCPAGRTRPVAGTH